MKNLPTHLKDPAQTKHKRLYDTVNSLISFLEEKFPQSDEPKEKEIIEPWCCDMGKEKDCKCKCHKPHWESDYAAIWSRYDSMFSFSRNDLRQDILELIHKLVK